MDYHSTNTLIQRNLSIKKKQNPNNHWWVPLNSLAIKDIYTNYRQQILYKTAPMNSFHKEESFCSYPRLADIV